jgi:hypothetical protein
MSPSDKVFAAIRMAKTPGQFFGALTHDPALLVGLVIIILLFLFFLRVYLWPSINPFTWMTDVWTWWTTPPPPTPDQAYPYAKDLYPTYR